MTVSHPVKNAVNYQRRILQFVSWDRKKQEWQSGCDRKEIWRRGRDSEDAQCSGSETYLRSIYPAFPVRLHHWNGWKHSSSSEQLEGQTFHAGATWVSRRQHQADRQRSHLGCHGVILGVLTNDLQLGHRVGGACWHTSVSPACVHPNLNMKRAEV